MNYQLLQLRAEIAAAAARLIAQDGAEYNTAIRKAAQRILGSSRLTADQLPDAAQVEEEVRQYQALFQGDEQPGRLQQMREVTLQLMDQLAEFHPHVTGAVLSGTAGEYDDIHLQLFAESAKDIEIYLLNKSPNVEISESPHFKGPRYEPVETISFLYKNEAVHAQLYELDDLRGARKLRADGRLQRADADALRALMAGEAN
jgi:hypothetical protein